MKFIIFPSLIDIQLTKYIASHPEISSTPMKDVLVISGLPRTGTTMLQQYSCLVLVYSFIRMLAADSRSRSSYMFEMSYMVDSFPPAPSREALKNDPRLAQVRTML